MKKNDINIIKKNHSFKRTYDELPLIIRGKKNISRPSQAKI